MADCCNVFIFKASMLEMEIVNIGQHCIMTADRGIGAVQKLYYAPRGGEVSE